MVANWWNPVELIAPMAYLVVFVYAMIGSTILFGKIIAVRDFRNQQAYLLRLQQIQSRMVDVDQPVSRPQTTHLHLATEGDVPAMRVSAEPSRNLTIPAPRSLVLEDRDERAS
jgi:hypothetical protein